MELTFQVRVDGEEDIQALVIQNDEENNTTL